MLAQDNEGRFQHAGKGIVNGVKVCSFDKEKSSIEVRVGLARGDSGETSEVVDDVPTVGLTNDSTWQLRRFLRDKEPVDRTEGR